MKNDKKVTPMRGTNVYLTPAEKEAIGRAIQEYIEKVEVAEGSYVEFFEKYDEKPLESVRKKICK